MDRPLPTPNGSLYTAILCVSIILGACGDTTSSQPHTDGSTTTPTTTLPTDPTVHVSSQTAANADAGFYKTGVTAYRWESLWEHTQMRDARQRFLTQTAPGLVLLEFTWPAQDGLTPPSQATWTAWLDTHYADIFTDILNAQGGLFLQLSGPPKWASSAPNEDGTVLPFGGARIWSRSPPEAADGTYPVWSSAIQQLAQWIVDRFPQATSQRRIVIGYGVELDNHEYYGDISTYAPAYNAAARAIRGVSPDLIVAGGGRLNAFSPKQDPPQHQDPRPVLDVWLEGCKALSCPIDLVFGHNFTLLPTPWSAAGEAPRSAHGDVVAGVQALLDRHAYSNVGIALTDHTSWEFKDLTDIHPWLSSEHDTVYRAAHLAASLIAMRREGFQAHTIGTLFEQAGEPQDFIGDWGLFTTYGIAKPAFHAASMSSVLSQGELLETTLDRERAPFVHVDAARTQEAVVVLVVRFVPDTSQRRLLYEAFAHRFLTEGDGLDALISALEHPTQDAQTRLINVLQSEDASLLNNPTPRTLEIFEGFFALARLAREAPETQTISVQLDASDVGSGVPVVYRLSATSSNSYHYCIELGMDCTNPQEVNDGPGALQAVDPLSVVWDAESQRVELTLESHQVDLLVFARNRD